MNIFKRATQIIGESVSATLLLCGSALAQQTDDGQHLNISNVRWSTNATRVIVKCPDTFTNRLDVYVCTNIVKGDWQLAATGLTVDAAHSLDWTGSLTNLNGKKFYIIIGNADLDSNGNGIPDAREKLIYKADPATMDSDHDGWSDGREVAIGTDPNDPLSFPTTISGTIRYDGSKIGQIYVVAVTNPTAWATNYCQILAAPGSYSIKNLPNQKSYRVKSWRDSDGDGTIDVWEAAGSYSSNPIYLTNDASGVDIVLTDPVSGDQLLTTPDTKFSPDRGFYETNISVTITSAPDAVIYYTLDGSAPTFMHGFVATGSVVLIISNTTCLRAMADEPDKAPTDIDTQTYIFLTDAISRTNAPARYPTNWSWTSDTNTYSITTDYAMGTNVVGSPDYAGLITNAMLCIPTLSIAMDPDDLFGVNGIYDKDSTNNTEGQYDKPASVELIYPDGRKGCHANCSIQPHSNFVEQGTPGDVMARANIKRSFGLSFKKEYGPGKLKHSFFENAPVNAESAATEFDKIILRAGSNRSYAGGHSDVDQVWTTYTRDQWGRDSQIAMTGNGAHGTFVHLYINGMYWGLYNPCERPDDHFSAEYFGGSNEDWYAGNDGGDVSGSNTVWTNLLAACADTNTDWTSQSAYTNIQSYLNVTNFCDYVLLWWYCGGGDWENGNFNSRNFYVGNRNSPTSGLIAYYCWDMEMSWAPSTITSDGAWVNPEFQEPTLSTACGSYLGGVFRPLWQNAEFRMLFADRLYKHCFHDGALSDVNSQTRWMKLCNFIDDAMIAESARWGDAKTPYADGTNSVALITRNDNWYPARDYVYRLMDGNSDRFVIACRWNAIYSWPLYPMIDPPEFNQQGGVVTNGFQLTLTSDGGQIYYTTNGIDPRIVGGDVYSNALVYSGAVTIGGTTTVKARAKSGDIWSALNAADFYVQVPTGGIRITEIMYNPSGSQDYEFIEFKNTGIGAVNMQGWQLTTAGTTINYTFTNGPTLGPDEYLVLAKNAFSFASRYPGVAIVGSYFNDYLKNSCDTVQVRNASSDLVLFVPYSDNNHNPAWPDDPDGKGYSLVCIDPAGNQADPANWRASAWINGSPGKDDVFVKDLGNSPPAVSAGGAMMYLSSVTNIPIRGLVSDDGYTTNALSFAWSEAGGTGDVVFGSATSLATTATFTNAGTYYLALTANDGGMSSTGYAIVIVAQEPATNDTNIVFWLRSDSGVFTNGSSGLTNWVDRTGSGNNAQPTNANQCPLWQDIVYKGEPGLYFNGTDDILTISSSNTVDSGSSYSNKMLSISFRTADDIDSRQVLYEQGGSNSGFNVYIWSNNLCMCAWSLPDWGPVYVGTPVAKDREYTAQMVLDAVNSNLEATLDGVVFGQANGVGPLAGDADGIGIGGVNGSTRFHDGSVGTSWTERFKGWISEIMHFGHKEDVKNYTVAGSGIGTVGPGSGGGVQNGNGQAGVAGTVVNSFGATPPSSITFGSKTVSIGVVADFNHDRKIDSSDEYQTNANNPFRFWINDDNDSGDVGWSDSSLLGATASDLPGQGLNCEFDSVFGRSDLEDYFPVWLDISAALAHFGPDYPFTYKLTQADAALKMVYTDLTKDHAGDYLTTDIANCDLSPQQYAYDAPVTLIGNNGLTLDKNFLYSIMHTPGKGVILLEGVNHTTKPLVLEIWSNNFWSSREVMSAQLPLSISGVTNMFRFANMRTLLGDNRTDVGNYQSNFEHEPPNNPDSACNSKNVIFIHGFNETPDDALGNISEVFKRLYWSGSRARFTGVTWFGDQGTPSCTHFHWDVTNAFVSAPLFANLLSYLSSNGQHENNVIAFSLGNMVVSSAIQDCGAAPTRYFMLHAAVAMEAYDKSEYNKVGDSANMIQSDWRRYDARLYASEWHKLWPEGGGEFPTDGRSTLTWNDRFSSVVGSGTYNFYSSRDDVLDDLNNGVVIDEATLLDFVGSWCQYSWCGQELLKGRTPVDQAGSTYGGWGVNPTRYVWNGNGFVRPEPDSDVVEALLQPPYSGLKTSPFFKPGGTEMDPLYGGHDYDDGSTFAAENRSKLLADMIPAISFATGRNFVTKIENSAGGNFDMDRLYETGWPAERVNNDKTKSNWLHGDYRYVAYRYVYTLFDKISKDIGGFNSQ